MSTTPSGRGYSTPFGTGPSPLRLLSLPHQHYSAQPPAPSVGRLKSGDGGSASVYDTPILTKIPFGDRPERKATFLSPIQAKTTVLLHHTSPGSHECTPTSSPVDSIRNDSHSTQVAELPTCAGVTSRPFFRMCPFLALCISRTHSRSTHSERIIMLRTIEISRYTSAGVNAAFVEGVFFPLHRSTNPSPPPTLVASAAQIHPLFFQQHPRILSQLQRRFSGDAGDPGEGTRTRTSQEAS